MKKIDVTMVTIAIQTVRSIRGDYNAALAQAELGNSRSAAASAKAALEDFGFTLRDDYRGLSIRFGGIGTTSTAGVPGAMANWLNAAEKKIGGAA